MPGQFFEGDMKYVYAIRYLTATVQCRHFLTSRCILFNFRSWVLVVELADRSCFVCNDTCMLHPSSLETCYKRVDNLFID